MQKTLIALLMGLFGTLVIAADAVPPHPYIKMETTEGTTDHGRSFPEARGQRFL
jgi:hypothetical protein